MEEQKVKGTMLLDFVKMIRANKQLDWDKHLKAEDWETINSLVLPAKWYPLELYKRCMTAAFYLIAQGSYEVARTNGQFLARHLFETTYKSMVQDKDPMQALSQYVLTYGTFFNFTLLKMEKLGPKKVKLVHEYDAGDKGNRPYCHQMQGFFEVLVQMTGGKNCKVVMTDKQWEGSPVTAFEVSWE